MIREAVVLAGGKGTRLRPITNKIPKPLVPVGNRPMVDYAIEILERGGINKVIVVVKYLGELIREYLEEQEHNIEILIPEVDPLDTADAVRKVSDLIEGDFIVSMADIVTNLSIKDLIAHHYKKKAFATMSLKDIEFPQRKFGVIWLGQDDRIKLFLEKPLPEDLFFSSLGFTHTESSGLSYNLVNTGIYAFNHELLTILDTAPDLMDFGRDVFPYLVQESYRVYGFVSDFYWMDAGNPKSYLWANWDVLRKWAWPLKPYGSEENGIWIGKNVIMEKGVQLKRPAAMADNVSIGKNSVIGPLTVIGSNVKIGNNVKVQESIILDDTKISDNSIISKSIICNGVVINERVKVMNSVIDSGLRLKKETIISENSVIEE